MEKLLIYPSQEELKLMLPKRAQKAHKGQCGKVGIIAGSRELLGAAILCARAALHSGAGLVYLMTIDSAVPAINIQYPELIVLPIPSKEGRLTHKAFPVIKSYIEEKGINSMAIGPGLGKHPLTVKLINQILTDICIKQHLPTVMDADALNAISEDIFSKTTYAQFILTPHEKEFERLFGLKPESERDRVLMTRRMASKIKQIILLKGYQTVIANQTHHIVNPTGNEGMATAGAGDVLTGIIASFIGQGVPLYDAAVLACYLHGRTGDIVKEKKGLYSLIASDLIQYLPYAFAELQHANKE